MKSGEEPGKVMSIALEDVSGQQVRTAQT